MASVKYAFSKCLEFSTKEIFWFFISSAVFAFLMRFGLWDLDKIGEGFSNLVLYIILFLITYFVFIIAQKFVATYQGYECKYEIWKYSLLIAFFVTVFIYGFIPPVLVDLLLKSNLAFFFLYLGNVDLKENPVLRLGKFRQSLNVKDLMWVGIAGPIAVALLMSLVYLPLYFLTGFTLFKHATLVGAVIIFFSSLPLPKTNGINVLYYSRWVWLTYFVVGLVLLILLLPFNILTYFIALVLIVIIVWLCSRLIKFFY